MVQKRPPAEELYDFSSKLPRSLEPGDEMVSDLGLLDENVAQLQHDSGKGEREGFPAKGKPECNGKLDNWQIVDLLTCTNKESETSAHGSISDSSWGTSATSEEDNGSDAAFPILLSQDYYNLENPFSVSVRPGDLYDSLLRYPPQKLVPLGREFQAEIPELGGPDSENLFRSSADSCEPLYVSSESLKSDILSRSSENIKFAGTCVIPMPELDVPGDVVEKVGDGRTECSCEDSGLVRCVNQHIEEARLRLQITVGTETFLRLGFGDMGEVVANKWNEEENEIFHDVIFSNPVSLGMNFWDQLAKVFPSRTKKEIVSFYFNVFILRKRAEQNRSDILDTDSDNDERETTNLSDDEIVEKTNEDDDFVYESREANFGSGEIYAVKKFEKDEVAQVNSVDGADENFSRNEVINRIPGTSCDDMVDSFTFDTPSQMSDMVFFNRAHVPCVQTWNSTLYGSGAVNCHDVRNGISTTNDIGELDCHKVENGISSVYEARELEGPDIRHGSLTECGNGLSSIATSEKDNCNKNWTSGSSGVVVSSEGHEPDLLAFPKNEDFLLSTSSMMEEVFGD